METSQQIFSMFYAISYGVMLGSLSSLKAFPWGWPAVQSKEKRIQLLLRLLFSVIFFNVGPFFIFAIGYEIFSEIKGELNYWFIVLSGLASLAAFAPYRVHHTLVSIRYKWFYDDEEWKKIADADNRMFRCSFLGHAIAVVFYLLPLGIIWCTLIMA